MSRSAAPRTALPVPAAILSFTILAACATGGEPVPAADTPQGRGQTIVAQECARCHAVGRYGTSPRDDAPPLRTVLSDYNTATLEMDLMEGMRIGHPDMPRFELDPMTADALIAYLQSIQE